METEARTDPWSGGAVSDALLPTANLDNTIGKPRDGAIQEGACSAW